MRERWSLVLLLMFPLAVDAAPPTLDSLFPAGGQAGTEVAIKVSGKGLDKGTPAAWASHPGVVIKPGEKGKPFIASISSEVPPGPYLVRVHTDEGASPPRIFVVGNLAESLEQEPNDSLADAQKAEAKMNAVINGVFEKSGDVDTHPIRVAKAKPVSITLHGYSLGSPMDPALRLLNERGQEVAASHDTHNLDPRLIHTPQADGIYFVQVFAFAHPPAADVTLKGSASHVYRLTVTDAVEAAGTLTEPAALELPTALLGCITQKGEEDRFTFKAKKGDELQIQVRAQALRSPLDATLQILDDAGKSLQLADDGDKEALDPSLRWKAPKEGEFTLVVADRFMHGGADHVYELSVKPFTPTLSATLALNAFRVEAGKTVEVKINVKPSGTFKEKFLVRAAQLPPGITCDSKEMPAKGGDATLVLKAAADAPASQAPFTIEVATSAPDPEQTVPATYAIPFTEPRGDLLIMSDTQPWLTVAGKAVKAE